MLETLESGIDNIKENEKEWKNSIENELEVLYPNDIGSYGEKILNDPRFSGLIGMSQEYIQDFRDTTVEFVKDVTKELPDKTESFDYEAIFNSAADGAVIGATVGGAFGATAAGAGAAPGALSGGIIGAVSGASGEIAKQLSISNGASEDLATGIKIGVEVATGAGLGKIVAKGVTSIASSADDIMKTASNTTTGEVVLNKVDDVVVYAKDTVKQVEFGTKGLLNDMKVHTFVDGNGREIFSKIEDIIDTTRTIPMKYIGSSAEKANSAGYLRDPIQFAKEYKNNFPETLSKANIARIDNNLAPIVDPQWLKFNPNHKTFLGETLEHHHLNNLGDAAYIPKSLHRLGSNKSIMHVDTSNLMTEALDVTKQRLQGV